MDGFRLTAKPVRGQFSFNSINPFSPQKEMSGKICNLDENNLLTETRHRKLVLDSIISQVSTCWSDSYRRYICKSNKDAVSASWLRFGRTAKRKIYKKTYAVDGKFDVELLVNHQKIASLYIEASKRAS